MDGGGRVLARMAYEDGEGVIVADIVPGKLGGAKAPIPQGFWNTELPQSALEAWEYLNPIGQRHYATTFRPTLVSGPGAGTR